VNGTKEILQVREGTSTVQVADQSEVLEVGDAISFASDVAHSYANENAVPARFSLTVFEPGVGAGAKPEASHDLSPRWSCRSARAPGYGSADECWSWWQSREAKSATVVTTTREPDGIGLRWGCCRPDRRTCSG
jgi:hypothetical protein